MDDLRSEETRSGPDEQVMFAVPQDEQLDPGEHKKLENAPTDMDASDAPKKPTTQKHIRYRVQIQNRNNEILHQREVSGPDNEDEGFGSTQDTLFEIVTTYISSGSASKNADVGYVPSMASVPTRSMHILSRGIAHALRSVVTFYPSQDLSGDIIKIPAPYTVLAHYYDELQAYRKSTRSRPEGENCPLEKNVDVELDILFKFMEENVIPTFREELSRRKRDCVTFEGYWVDLRPGTPFVAQRAVSGDRIGGVIHSLEGGVFTTPPTDWRINFWSMKYDGICVGRQRGVLTKSQWDGETSPLTLKPVDFKAKEREEYVNTIIRQGKAYWNLLGKHCKYFRGKATAFPHEKVDSLVMVDMDDYYASYAQKRPVLLDSTEDNRTRIPDCNCTICNQRTKKSSSDNDDLFFKNMYPKTTPELEDAQCFLLPNEIFGYVFKTRSWTTLPVDGFHEPEFKESMIDNLVMDPKRLSIIKALAKSYARLDQKGQELTEDAWSADFVKDKGMGLNFLLHGSPGTGKTCTAECIAAYTSRSLMALTTRDIGTTASEVESNLIDHFRRAKSWGAVLLIDEADVFLERRSTADLTRNSLVAGFLRALEWYDGILFLTTNRVGTFDDAFISRIHVKLYYPDFDDQTRRKVWQTFIDKLKKERGHYIWLNIDAKEYLEGKELKAVKWNGREIRNAFQTAVALAEYDGEKDSENKIVLTDKHLKAVVEMSRDFKVYIDDVHLGMSEGKRAERRKERLERIDSQN